MMNSLTSREREIVLVLASGGLSNKDVGRRLNLSEGTVKVHLHNVYSKLGVKNRTALVVLAHTEFVSVRRLVHANWVTEAIEARPLSPYLLIKWRPRLALLPRTTV
jgi:DNA-binding CsgD family transcriptional regulator